MKSKLGISLLISTVILSSAPIPMIAEEHIDSNPDQQTTPANDLQPKTVSEPLDTKKLEGSISDDTVTEQSTIQEITDTTNESQTEENQEPISEQSEEVEAPIEDREYADDEFVFNSSLQQEIRDAAMANSSSLSRNAYAANHVSSFIQRVAPHATKIANQYNLYASVMIAQAALESDWGRSTLGKEPNNNLFGIKGSYNGQSVTMRTWEVINGQTVWINAKFRKYPSPLESMEDNAKLLRGGINGAPNFYSGTWKEKTKSYEDATKWLTGRYATDPDYASKLNATIRANNLTMYDSGQLNPNDKKIVSSIAINQTKKIINTSYYIYTTPYNTPNSYRTGQISAYYGNGTAVNVTKYATTSQGIKTYYINGVGWVDARALGDFATFNATAGFKQKQMKIANTGYYIYTTPFNTINSSRTEQISARLKENQTITVSKYGTTSEGIKTYFVDNYGWVDYRALKEMPTFTEQALTKQMRIADSGYYFYNLPYDTANSARVTQIKNKFENNSAVTVTKLATTSTGFKTYYVEGQGWVDLKALKENATFTEKTMNETMRIANNGYYFYNKPYNTSDAKRVGQIKEQVAIDTQVKVTKIATTSEGVRTYFLPDYGQNKEGAWVDFNALKSIPTFKANAIKKTMRIANDSYYFYSTPYKTLDSVRTAQIKEKLAINDQVLATKETTTSAGVKTYYLDGLGWVDYNSVKDVSTLASNVNVNEYMRVNNNNYFFYSQPYNTLDSKKMNQIKDELDLNQQVHVTKYAITSTGLNTYYLPDYNAWVDARSLKAASTIASEQTLNQTMTIANNGYYFYSHPFNTKDAIRGAQIKTKFNVNSAVTVTKYVVTSTGLRTYFIPDHGWVDANSLK